MKKKLLLSVLSLVLILGILQPYSLNLSVFASSANAASNQNKDDCGCGVGAKGGKSAKETTKFENKEMIKKIKDNLKQWHKTKQSYYGIEDFDWNYVAAIDYGEGQYGITVPLKKNTTEFNVFLFIAYDKNNNTLTLNKSVLLEAQKTSEKTDTAVYKTLDNVPIVGLEINEETGMAKKVIYDIETKIETASLFKQNTASAGYWEDVRKCLLVVWNNDIPEWLKWTCSAACGSVLFGGNVVGGAVCAGCLGGVAMGCLMYPRTS